MATNEPFPVTNPEEVYHSLITFNSEAHSSDELPRSILRSKFWVYHQQSHMFAPNKFAAFSGMTFERYRAANKSRSKAKLAMSEKHEKFHTTPFVAGPAKDAIETALNSTFMPDDTLRSALMLWAAPFGVIKESPEWEFIKLDFKPGSTHVKFVGQAVSDEEFPEAREKMRLHRQKERNPKAVRRKKETVLAEKGKLRCEVCDFDFAVTYGVLGGGFAECHHRTPLAKLSEGHRTRLSDLAIVCSNCHRMLHRRHVLTVEELRKIVLANRAQN